MKPTPILLLITAGLVAGCSGRDISAQLQATPPSGPTPLWVDFETAGSEDLRGGALRARFDFDGDGTFDTEANLESASRYRYDYPGTYRAIAELSSTDGRVETVQVMVQVAENQAPVAQLTANVTAGRLPMTVTLDASASDDPDSDGPLEFRFDTDGDGTFDTDWQASPAAQVILQKPGSYLPTVEVRDPGEAVGRAQLSTPVEVAAGADIDVDTDRNGRIDDDDELGEEAWDRRRGALMIANLDDDDGNGRPDGLDRGLAGPGDEIELTSILIGAFADLAPDATVRVHVEPAAASSRVALYTAGFRPLNATEGAYVIDPSELANPMRLWLEALEPRSGAWDGQVQLRLQITTAAEDLVDTVALRVGPVVFPHHLRPAKQLWVMDITDGRFEPNQAFTRPMQAGLPNEVGFNAVDQYAYGADRWLQDPLQQGYQEMPVEGGLTRMPTFLKLERPTGEFGLEPFVDLELLGPGVGRAYAGPGRHTSLSYGGNLEVAPPHTSAAGEYPLGRLVIGGGDLGMLDGTPWEDHMEQQQWSWLDAQQVQGPAIEVSTEWLAVGHVDEIFLFLPNRLAAEGERPWKVVIASPDLGWQILESASAAGQGSAVVFRGRQTQTTVDRILGDDDLVDINDAAQARIDTVRDDLTAGLGLTDADFIEVPVLYESIEFDGLSLSAAYNPGIQNLVLANDVLFVPDPEGPVIDGKDPWAEAAREVIEALGLNVQFVDVFDAYHLQLGEAHCGTLVERTAPDTPWWTAYEGGE